MKLRILDDSIRLRLTQSEVLRVAEGRGVHSHTRFPHGMILGYALELSDGDSITAHLTDGVIAIQVPGAVARAWATTDQVSLTAQQAIDGGALSLLVEKDFQCLEPRSGEDDGDAFPNPKAR